MSKRPSASSGPTGQLPPGFSLQKMANFGTSETWVARIQLGIPEMSMVAFGSNETQQEFKEAWHHVGMKLGEAFGALVDVRRLVADPQTALLDLSRAYNSLYSLLWAAYKDRWQTAMKLLGLDMSFLFVKGQNFETRFAEFAAAHPTIDLDTLKKVATEDRATWQNRLADYRNDEIEHRSGTQQVEFFENPKSAEVAFQNVWRTMEDWAIAAIGEHVKPPMYIVAIPKAERDPALPKKYRLGFDQSVLPKSEGATL